MDYLFFAHNGVDHATDTEATSHQLSTLLLAVAITLVAIAVMFFVVKLINRRQTEDEEDN